MLFNSQIFVFVFLPVVWVLYFGLHYLQMHRTAKVFLTLASLVFYGYYNIAYVGLLLGSILFNYGVYLLLGRLRKQDGGYTCGSSGGRRRCKPPCLVLF